MSDTTPTDDGVSETDSAGPDDRPTVLVVDDEPRVVQAFDLWLRGEYRVVTATSGEDALDRLAETDIDLVLLDRHMPGMHGDEVLAEIRDGDHDCRVAMVTAVDPDFDIVEMPFDHYISKPVDESELRDAVERLLGFESYDRQLNELYTVTQKLAVLEGQKPRVELQEDERYRELRARKEQLEADLGATTDALEASEFDTLFEVADLDP